MMIENYVQIEFFESVPVVDEVHRIKEQAIKYAASNIFQCSGRRNIVRMYLENRDIKSAFREFDNCFKSYGFANQEYMFNAYCGDGNIKIKDQFEFKVTSKELFAHLLILWEEGLRPSL